MTYCNTPPTKTLRTPVQLSVFSCLSISTILFSSISSYEGSRTRNLKTFPNICAKEKARWMRYKERPSTLLRTFMRSEPTYWEEDSTSTQNRSTKRLFGWNWIICIHVPCGADWRYHNEFQEAVFRLHGRILIVAVVSMAFGNQTFKSLTALFDFTTEVFLMIPVQSKPEVAQGFEQIFVKFMSESVKISGDSKHSLYHLTSDAQRKVAKWVATLLNG